MKKRKSPNTKAKTLRYADIVVTDTMMEPTIRRQDRVTVDFDAKKIDRKGIYLVSWAAKPTVISAVFVRAEPTAIGGTKFELDNPTMHAAAFGPHRHGVAYLTVLGRACLLHRDLDLRRAPGTRQPRA